MAMAHRFSSPRVAASWLGATLAMVAAVALGSCQPPLPEPTSAHLVSAREQWPDASLSELSRGRLLYEQRCSVCHSLVAPTQLPPRAWAAMVATMRRDQGVDLSNGEAQAIERYLFVAASDGERDPTAAPSSATGG